MSHTALRLVAHGSFVFNSRLAVGASSKKGWQLAVGSWQLRPFRRGRPAAPDARCPRGHKQQATRPKLPTANSFSLDGSPRHSPHKAAPDRRRQRETPLFVFCPSDLPVKISSLLATRTALGSSGGAGALALFETANRQLPTTNLQRASARRRHSRIASRPSAPSLLLINRPRRSSTISVGTPLIRPS